MRLATVETAASTQAVVVRDDGVVPIPGHLDIGSVLMAGDAGMDAARAAHRHGVAALLDRSSLVRPVLAPGAVVCVGLNYRSHILEMGRDLPTAPTLFSKLPRALTDPDAEVVLDGVSSKWDYEGELVVVVGRGGRRIPADRALDHVAGFSVLNDVTARDLQRRTLQWFAGKTLERSTPWGPWIVTTDELGDLGSRVLRVEVNGEERQRAPLGDLVFDAAALIADLSRLVELHPGDLIATGTPGGVGVAEDRFLRAGDVVTVEIDGIGAIRNLFTEA